MNEESTAKLLASMMNEASDDTWKVLAEDYGHFDFYCYFPYLDDNYKLVFSINHIGGIHFAETSLDIKEITILYKLCQVVIDYNYHD